MRRLPPLTAIEAFVQVARLGSMKAAADELALSSPALSRRIQALERYAGKPLLTRSHGGVRPNADGERFLDAIVPALEQISAAAESLTSGNEVSRLRLGVLPLYASQRLMPRLPSLRQRHPRLHLDLDTGSHSLSRLGDTLDAAIVMTRDVDPHLYARRIDTNVIYPIAAKSLIEGTEAIREPSDLSRATILLHRDMADNFSAFMTHLGLARTEPVATDFFDSGQLMLEAAAGGLGVAFMHRNQFEGARDPRLVRLFDVEVESPYSYWFACRPRALEQRSVRQFHDWLFEEVGERAEAA